MKKQSLLILSSLICMSLCGCNNETKDYTVKEVNVIREMKNDKAVVDKQLSLHFYNDTPNIPYIKVSEYFKEFFNSDLKLSKHNNTYQYNLSDSCYIAFDTKEDIFTGLGIVELNTHPDAKSSTGKTFLHNDSSSSTTPRANSVNLSNYSIDIHEDDNEAYVPVTFLSKLSGGMEMFNVQYNGKDIYFIDEQGQLYDGDERGTTYFASSYYDELFDFTTPRKKDLAKYAYNELCFVFDNLRGYTSQMLFIDNNLLSLGLNGLLEQYYPKIKEYLLSTDKQLYYQGLFALFAGLHDGGHTAITCDHPSYTQIIQQASTVPEFTSVASEFMLDLLKDQYSKTNFQSAKTKVFNLDKETYKKNPNYYYYDSINQTAVIGFDHFAVDYQAWDKFYQNQVEAPVDTDTFAFMRSKFYQAKEDGAKNLVIDLTSNGGGDSGALMGIVGLLNGAKASFDKNDTFNHVRHVDKYSVDINLDGKYDDKDIAEAKGFNFHVGILTSSCAFSCGNLLPSVLKGLGYKILGEKSGGGSCAIILESTAEGIPYGHSSYLCLSDAKGNNIDSGVPVDYVIERQADPSSVGPFMFDASNFFDITSIANYLNSAYKA